MAAKVRAVTVAVSCGAVRCGALWVLSAAANGLCPHRSVSAALRLVGLFCRPNIVVDLSAAGALGAMSPTTPSPSLSPSPPPGLPGDASMLAVRSCCAIIGRLIADFFSIERLGPGWTSGHAVPLHGSPILVPNPMQAHLAIHVRERRARSR